MEMKKNLKGTIEEGARELGEKGSCLHSLKPSSKRPDKEGLRDRKGCLKSGKKGQIPETTTGRIKENWERLMRSGSASLC